MVAKTIIANYGDWSLGKTGSIMRVFEKLSKRVEKESDVRVLHKPENSDGDICAIITINDIKVGIASQGDPYSRQREWMKELVNHGCRIILAACRYYGATVDVIESYNPPYRIYWSCNARLYEAGTNPRVAPKGICSRFNEQWAEEIANMIESWCYA